jgi:alginate O-acetyltransferase complex protein AlgI
MGLEVVLACALGMLIQRWWPGVQNARRRTAALITISAAVVAYWQLLGLLVTLVLTVVTWGLMRRAAAPGPHSDAIAALGIVSLVAVLVAFKYVPWLLSLSIPAQAPAPDQWIVPLGLSFTVFRLIGAILDSRALGLRVPGLQLVLLAVFFPTYRAGPIETLRSLAPAEGASAGRDHHWAYRRIFVGICRKVILADSLYAFVLAPWTAHGVNHLSPAQCLALPILLGLYVYWDFAGYSDIAIGMGALLGYRVRENFDRPYLSRSVVDFWNRWHITLSEWIRTRLFMKLVGRRSPRWALYLATVVSMALCGLWHGAGVNFLLWGVWHGLGLVAVHVFGDVQRHLPVLRRLATVPGANAVSIALTFTYVSLGWLIFFLPVPSAWAVLQRALSWRPGSASPDALILVAVAALLATGVLLTRVTPAWPRLPYLLKGTAVTAASAVILYLLLFRQSGMQDFVYARF